jgi:hypothetical protein
MESEYQVQNRKGTEGIRKVIAPRWMRDRAYMRTPTLTKPCQNIFLVEVWNSTHCDSLEHPVLGIGVIIHLCLNDGNSGETDCKRVIYQDASRVGYEVLTCMRPISQGRQRLWCYPKSPCPSSQALDLYSAVKKNDSGCWGPTEGGCSVSVATGNNTMSSKYILGPIASQHRGPWRAENDKNPILVPRSSTHGRE